MRPGEQERLAYKFIRHSLAMQGLSDGLITAERLGTIGSRLDWQIKQLRYRSRDVAFGKLQPSDLSVLLANLRSTVDKLIGRNACATIVRQLERECVCLEDYLTAAGVALT